MKVGFIVDGIGEVRALPGLLARLDTPHDLVLTPVQEALQPKATPIKIAEAVIRACESLARKHVDLAVVVMDLEDRDDCPGALAREIEKQIANLLVRHDLRLSVQVVLKVKTFENWLVADPDCLRAMPRLFPDARRILNAVRRGNADGINGLEILERARGARSEFHKVKGAVSICERLDPGRAALNSRSFRRFLRVLGDIRYADQSRLPNPDA